MLHHMLRLCKEVSRSAFATAGSAARRGTAPPARRSEGLAYGPGLLMGGAAAARSVGRGEVGPEVNRRDVVDAGPAQPVLEEGGLEILAEGVAASRSVDGAGVDDGGLLAGQQARVAALGLEAEDHAGLADHVDELLEDAGDAGVPHRHAE